MNKKNKLEQTKKNKYHFVRAANIIKSKDDAEDHLGDGDH